MLRVWVNSGVINPKQNGTQTLLHQNLILGPNLYATGGGTKSVQVSRCIPITNKIMFKNVVRYRWVYIIICGRFGAFRYDESRRNNV